MHAKIQQVQYWFSWKLYAGFPLLFQQWFVLKYQLHDFVFYGK
jgi:hypothetical protein